jgi:hypothetical protein
VERLKKGWPARVSGAGGWWRCDAGARGAHPWLPAMQEAVAMGWRLELLPHAVRHGKMQRKRNKIGMAGVRAPHVSDCGSW